MGCAAIFGKGIEIKHNVMKSDMPMLYGSAFLLFFALQDFKLKMISELSSIYEMDELNSIFNLLSEDYLKIPRSKILLANEIDLDESNQTLFLSSLERLKTH